MKASYPLVVITGPTASGKSTLAIEMAQKFNGEIICADSRTVFRQLDIGTAKPTALEQGGVPHWGLDLIDPDESFSAADFKEYALKKIEEIRERNHIPFLVGGTGLYIDAVIFDYVFGPPVNIEQRERLESMSLESLHDYCRDNNITLPENHLNKRYVIRAIERSAEKIRSNNTLIDDCIVVGLATEKEELLQRMRSRARQMLDFGVVEEAMFVSERYGWKSQALTGNVYPAIHSYLEGKLSRGELEDKITTLDWRLAKRQMTWLRRNPYIHWSDLSSMRVYLSSSLAKE